MNDNPVAVPILYLIYSTVKLGKGSLIVPTHVATPDPLPNI